MNSPTNLPSYSTHSPRSWYEHAKKNTDFIYDAAQLRGIDALEALYQELITFKKQRNRLFGKILPQPKVPKGVYLWGDVGRGKSFLMDIFYQTLPYQRKRRVHFHAFMSEIHERLKGLKHKENPLDSVAKDIAKETRVLCFDEFHVSDIADAMILSGLLTGLAQYGVILVATSNYPPNALYPNGLKRDAFFPAIKLLEQNLEVVEINGEHDFRLKDMTQASVFFTPNDSNSQKNLESLFKNLADGHGPIADSISILGRNISIIGSYNKIIWFDFDILCKGHRSQEDYLILAQNYQTIFLSNVPVMSSFEKNEARRLTWLIDVLYDYKVKLVMSSAASVEKLYTEGDFAQEFSRTVSRMIEMQSSNYLALPHLTLD